MKYFTSEWWAAGCENAAEVFARYEGYLASVRGSLPPALVELEASHTLHDSEVKRITCNFQNHTAEMFLHGWDRELQHPVHYTLRFSGVSMLDQVFPQAEYVEAELGDLGYWECELLSEVVQVSMLFVSGAEFRIQFTGFEFSHEQPRA